MLLASLKGLNTLALIFGLGVGYGVSTYLGWGFFPMCKRDSAPYSLSR